MAWWHTIPIFSKTVTDKRMNRHNTHCAEFSRTSAWWQPTTTTTMALLCWREKSWWKLILLMFLFRNSHSSPVPCRNIKRIHTFAQSSKQITPLPGHRLICPSFRLHTERQWHSHTHDNHFMDYVNIYVSRIIYTISSKRNEPQSSARCLATWIYSHQSEMSCPFPFLWVSLQN